MPTLQLALALLCAAAAEPPFDAPGHPVTADAAAVPVAIPASSRPTPPRAADGRTAPLPIAGYRLVSRFQGPRCRHVPSCSAFAAEAMRRHGPLLGAWIGVSRLLRGERASALALLPRDAEGRFLDPLENATFFLRSDDLAAQP